MNGQPEKHNCWRWSTRKRVGLIVTERQADRCGCESLCGQCQTLLQSSEGCTLHCAERQTQQRFPQTIGGFCLPVFEPAIDGVQHPTKHFAWQKPTVGCQALNLNGFHQYDRLESNHLDWAKKPLPSSDEYTLSCYAQGKRASSLSYESKASVKKLSHTLRDVLSFCRAYLTNLIVHCRSCLSSSDHQYQVFQSRLHSFGSPVGAL